jgi:Arylsulfotransferase (ASST)
MRARRWAGVALAAASLTLLSLGAIEVGCDGSGSELAGGGTNPADSGGAPLPEGGLYLTTLRVSASGSATNLLVPDFAPEINDYYVRCDAQDNALTVSMTASNGAESQLLEPTTSAAAPQQTVALGVQENQAIVAAAVEGPATNAYWVRCLPPTFPEMAWDVYAEAGAPTPGYYLVGDNWAVSNTTSAYAMVLDTHGVPVWYYEEPVPPAPWANGVFDVDVLAPGSLSFTANQPTLAWQIHELSPFGVTGAGTAGPQLDNHELRLLANGHYLMFTIPLYTGYDLSNLSLPGLPDGGTGQTDQPIASCKILEVDPATQDVVWSWDAVDHFDPNTATTNPTAGAGTWIASDGKLAWDVFHCNSIDVDPATGNLLVSARNMNSVFYVDYLNHKVLWKMGGADSSKDGARFVPVADPFYGQHDARLRQGWSTTCGGRGEISMFDDETWGPSPARGVVYDVNVGQGGGDCGSAAATEVWQFYGQTQAQYMGSFRILADGSRTIGWGIGEPGLILTEVDEGANALVDLRFPPGGSSYRAIKVPADALDLGLLRSTAGAQVSGW